MHLAERSPLFHRPVIFILRKTVVHQLSGIRPFLFLAGIAPAAAQHSRNQPHAVPLRRADKAMPRLIGISRFHTHRAIIFPQKTVRVRDRDLPSAVFLRYINFRQGNDAAKVLVFQRISRNPRHVACRRMVLFQRQAAVQTVRRTKDGILRPNLRRLCCHFRAEFLH